MGKEEGGGGGSQRKKPETLLVGGYLNTLIIHKIWTVRNEFDPNESLHAEFAWMLMTP